LPRVSALSTGQISSAAPPQRAPTMTRKQCWMLLLAFEILVLGFAQSMFQPVRQPGITIEMSVKPNHVVT
jgi:hypothetical protein